MRRALAANPSVEQRRRIEDLLRKLPDSLPVPPPAQLQNLRAMAVLEHAGTEAARRFLKEISQGHSGAHLTHEAGESLMRSLRRASKP